MDKKDLGRRLEQLDKAITDSRLNIRVSVEHVDELQELTFFDPVTDDEYGTLRLYSSEES